MDIREIAQQLYLFMRMYIQNHEQSLVNLSPRILSADLRSKSINFQTVDNYLIRSKKIQKNFLRTKFDKNRYQDCNTNFSFQPNIQVKSYQLNYFCDLSKRRRVYNFSYLVYLIIKMKSYLLEIYIRFLTKVCLYMSWKVRTSS